MSSKVNKIVSNGPALLPDGRQIKVLRLFQGRDKRMMAAFLLGKRKMKIELRLLKGIPSEKDSSDGV